MDGLGEVGMDISVDVGDVKVGVTWYTKEGSK